MRIFVIIAITAAIGCTKPNPNRCCTDEADCSTKGIPVGSICDQGLVCRGNQCIAQPCASASECDPAAPYCVAELCSEMCIEDLHCPGFGQSGMPYCEGGACVVCRTSETDCPASAPICSGGVCRTCTTHSECSSDLCDVDSGTCISETTIAYAAPSGSATSGCSKVDPCTFDRVLAVVDATRPNVKLASGSHSTTGPSFTRNLTVAFYGPATITGDIVMASASHFRLRDIDMVGGLVCARGTQLNPSATVDLARLTATGPYPLLMTSCDAVVRSVKLRSTDVFNDVITFSGSGGDYSSLKMSESELDGGRRGIYAFNYGSVQIVNSVFKNQSEAALFIGATPPATSSISFSTFYNSKLACGTGNLVATFRNNIFLNEASGAPADTVIGTQCVHTYSLVKPQTTAIGSTNILTMDPRFVNGATGDFHLIAGSPAIDAADPAATETVDFAGTARPQGTRRDMGAFEYKP